MVLLLIYTHIIHLYSKTIDVDGVYMKGVQERHQITSVILQGIRMVSSRSPYLALYFFSVGWINTPASLIFWILYYLYQYLTVDSKHTIPTDTVFFLNNNLPLWLGCGKGLFQKSLIEHVFVYPVKLGIYTKVQMTMEFVSIFMIIFINDYMAISVIWVWLCGQR